MDMRQIIGFIIIVLGLAIIIYALHRGDCLYHRYQLWDREHSRQI